MNSLGGCRIILKVFIFWHPLRCPCRPWCSTTLGGFFVPESGTSRRTPETRECTWSSFAFSFLFGLLFGLLSGSVHTLVLSLVITSFILVFSTVPCLIVGYLVFVRLRVPFPLNCSFPLMGVSVLLRLDKELVPVPIVVVGSLGLDQLFVLIPIGFLLG